MNNINYNDFINICRTCLFSCESKPIQQDNLIIEILHNVTGIQFETNDELPQQICLKCFDKINEIHAFAFQCKQAHFSLTKCLNNHKNLIETETVTIEEHKIKIENRFDESLSGNLKIKQEIIEETTNELSNENSNAETTVESDLFKPNTSDIKIEGGNELRKTKKFKCNVCEKVFIKKHSIKRHLRTHSGELPYQCDICNKSFNSPSTLSNHKPTHSDERPYECDVCKKAFKFSYVLIRHKRIHSDEPANECNVCTKTFRRDFDLKRHMRVHSGERPYKCFICGESFAYSCQLKKHKEIHIH